MTPPQASEAAVMADKRIFKIDCGLDLSLKLSIDTAILTPEWAGEIARFWSNKDAVLAASDDDEYQAVARLAAPWLWGYMLHDGYSATAAVEALHEQEGWCIPSKTLGIEIVEYDFPDMDPEYLDVAEEATP